MQMSREQFEQITGERLPRNAKIVTRDDMMQGQNYQQNVQPNYQPYRQQNGQPNYQPYQQQSVQPNYQPYQQQNGQPNYAQYQQPNVQQYPQTYGQMNNLQPNMPNNLDIRSSQKEKAPHSGQVLASIGIGVLALFFTGMLSINLSLAVLAFCIASASHFIGLDTEPHRQESKFIAKVVTGCGILAGTGLFAGLFLPDVIGNVIGSAIAIAIGGAVIASPTIALRLKMRRCTEKVRAVCIGLHSKRGSGRHHNMVHAPIWQYMLGGHAYTQTESVYCNPPEFHEGEGAEILVNPNDPMDITRGKSSGKTAVTMAGVIVALLGVITLLQSLGLL